MLSDDDPTLAQLMRLKRPHGGVLLLTLAMSLVMLAHVLFAGEYVMVLLEKVRLRYSEEAYQHVLSLTALSEQLRSASEQSKLLQINAFVNEHVQFLDDAELWNTQDYWASPLETLGRGAGDCEDFSIAKYMLLKKLGVAQDKLRMTYVKATLPSGNVRAHMVLAYYATASSEPLILDNLSTEVLPASRRTDLAPVFSFNEKGLFLANMPTVRAGSPTNISKWRDVLQRMHEDGLD